jgi:hypothetical protein
VSDPTAEIVIEKYAEGKGIDKEEAKKKLLPVLQEKKKSFDAESQRLLVACDVLGKVREIGKDADQATKDILGKLTLGVVSKAIADKGEDSDPVEEGISEAAKHVAKLKFIDGAFGGDAMKQLEEFRKELAELKNTVINEKKSKELEELTAKFEEAVKPFEERLALIEQKITGEPQKPQGTEDLLEQVNAITDQSKKWLMHAGYRVEPDKGMSKEEVQKMIEEAQKGALEKLPPDELKKRLESAGYKILGGPITWEQAEAMYKEAYTKGQESALDDKRIDATSNLIQQSLREVIGLFKPAVQAWLQGELEKGGKLPSSGPSPSEQSSPSEA